MHSVQRASVHSATERCLLPQLRSFRAVQNDSLVSVLRGAVFSGYAIASEALAAVMRAADGRGPRTALTEAILQRLSLKQPSDLIGYGKK